MSDVKELQLRDLYLERKCINTQRKEILDKLIDDLSKGTWDSLQRKAQRCGLLTVVLSHFKYITKLENPDSMQYEYDLVVEDLKSNTWYTTIIEDDEYKFIIESKIEAMDEAVKQLEYCIAILSERINEILGGVDSESYRDYITYTRLGAESTQLKIAMNASHGYNKAPRFFN